MKYLVTGGTGQLGTELSQMLETNGESYVSYGSREMNILDKEQVRKIMTKEKPDVVFHCAAYTAVDKAEDDKEKNWNVNVEGTRNVASLCKELDCVMVYVSTDYVFDGKLTEEYSEEDQTNPLNEYGKAKLAGEKVVQDMLDNYFIVRTSWVFGEHGPNFVYSMKRLAASHDKLTIVDDQLGRPTWTKTLSEFLMHLVETKQAYGIYHLSNSGACSWYEFAREILKDQPADVEPILSKDYPQKAERPKQNILNIEKSQKTGFHIPHWKEALQQFNTETNNK